MAFLLKESSECVKSELNLFLAPPTQTVIEKGQWVQFHPITNVADGGPIEFLIPGSGDAYLDLSQIQLHVRAKIFKSDVDVCLNERTVSSSNNTYPYRAIIETLLNHGYDSKTSHLTSELYYKDTAGRMNVYDENDKEPNEGFKSRVKFIKGSGTVDMVGRLHVDLFNQDRLLLNLVDVKLQLIRSKPSFCLMGEGDYNVIFEHVSLYVRKVQVNPAVVIGHAKALERTTAKYPIDRVSCKVFSIPQSSYSFIQDNVFSGQMPKRIIIACVDNDAFNGNYKKSPFEFKHYDVNFIGVYVDGQPVPHQPLELDFEKGNYIQAYNNLFLNSEGLHLSRSEFSKGYSLFFLFDLSPDLCEGEHFNLIRHSNLRVELKFNKALNETVSLIVFAEFESLIEINKTRNVLFDFGN
ncbi:uncharacterized protein F54H12.2 [Trichonephila clavipes]|uniref:Uncharacterized protein F54H12.2 n=1 Tax=Trichonephila clavipes TaxID=2585209 RepID=A0A8X6WI35_TRICX|nr:uncharacterized protein F54H12.2 [Trichonephila clavipes]